MGIAVVIDLPMPGRRRRHIFYEVGRKVAQHQVILSGDMNTEAIIAKLMWALGKN